MNAYDKIINNELAELNRAVAGASDSFIKYVNADNPTYKKEWHKNYRLWIKKAEGIVNAIKLVEEF